MATTARDGQEKAANAWDELVGTTASEWDGKDLTADPATGAPATPEPAATAPAAPVAAEPKGEEPPAPEGQPEPAATPEAAPPADIDPLAGSEPFRYKGMDGSEKALDGVYRFPGEGLMVPEDKVADFERIVSEREQAVTLVTAAAERIQQLDKLAAWQTTGDDGATVTLTGREGLEAMRVSHARLEATLGTLIDALKSDPASLIAVNDQNQIILAPDAIQNLMTRAELNEMRAEQQIRAALGRVLTPQAPAPNTTQQDYTQHAPALIAQALTGTGLDAKALTPDDVQELTAVLPRFVRETTPAERAANPALGPQIVDALYGQMVANRAKLRAQTTQTAKSAEVAGKVNAAVTQMRQPQAGARQAAAPAAPAAPSKEKPRSWDSLTSDLIEQAVQEFGH